MPIRFKTPDGAIHEVKCYRSLNLLGHAQMIELSIGSECGGHCICGKDRVRVSKEDRDKFSPPTQEECGHLSKEELKDGLRLGCQTYPSEDDLRVEIQVLRN